MDFAFDQNVSAQWLADALPHGVAVLNDRYQLISTNNCFRKLVPCLNADFPSCWLKSVHSEDHDRVSTGYREASISKKPLRIEYHVSGCDSMWCVMTLDRLESANSHYFGLGAGGGFICTIADISPEKNAELLEKQAADEAQVRMKQQERYMDMVSHEIRNPLSAMLHCYEEIMDEIQDKQLDQDSLMNITESAETIKLCIMHQKKIVNDVLTFSKLDASMLSLSPRKVQPKRHLTIPLAILRPEIQKNNIQFEYKIDISYANCEIDWVMADLDRMGQVLINLLSNAIKFTAKSKKQRTIRVSVGASMERPSSYPHDVVFFDTSEAGLRNDATNASAWGSGEVAYIMVAVKDSGIGISSQAQKWLFERFKQATRNTESSYGGSGLGLNVCREICHLHGGEIGVSSKEGHGSTFGFFFRVRHTDDINIDEYDRLEASQIDMLCSDIQTLGNEMSGINELTKEPEILENRPVMSAEEVASGTIKDKKKSYICGIARDVSREQIYEDSRQSRNNIKGLGGQRVLLVEDNVINRRIILRKLEKLGFEVSEASDGQEALDATKDTPFDCVLMDQQMPVMDGNSATKAIRDHEKEIGGYVPILGVTADPRRAQQDEMFRAGIDDIIFKPYGTRELIEKINHLSLLKQNHLAG